MAGCEVCGIALSDDGKLCPSCHSKAGLADARAARRPELPCMRCGGLELVHAQIRERTAGNIGSDSNAERVVPFAVTYATGEEYASTGFFSTKKVPSATPNTKRPYGILEAYVCRACGFVEWYARSPEEIPIGAALGTELVAIPAPKYR